MDIRKWTSGRRAHVGAALVAVAVVAALGGVALAVQDHRRSAAGESSGGAPGTAAVGQIKAALAGLRYESSLGLQIQVPDSWKVNDTGCHQTAAASVNRGTGTMLMCYSPTPPRKEIATIQASSDRPDVAIDADASKLEERAGTLDGVPIRRAEGPIANGMFAGWITAPARGVELVARTRTMATLTAILDSAELVDVDHFGCPTDGPTGRPPTNGSDQTFVAARPTEIAVCYYGDYYVEPSVLQSSALQSGDAAVALAASLNRAAHGPNPDRPEEECLRSELLPRIDVVLLVRSADRTQPVYVTFSSCIDRKLDNGLEYRHITLDLLTQILKNNGAGFGFGA